MSFVTTSVPTTDGSTQSVDATLAAATAGAPLVAPAVIIPANTVLTFYVVEDGKFNFSVARFPFRSIKALSVLRSRYPYAQVNSVSLSLTRIPGISYDVVALVAPRWLGRTDDDSGFNKDSNFDNYSSFPGAQFAAFRVTNTAVDVVELSLPIPPGLDINVGFVGSLFPEAAIFIAAKPIGSVASVVKGGYSCFLRTPVSCSGHGFIGTF